MVTAWSAATVRERELAVGRGVGIGPHPCRPPRRRVIWDATAGVPVGSDGIDQADGPTHGAGRSTPGDGFRASRLSPSGVGS